MEALDSIISRIRAKQIQSGMMPAQSDTVRSYKCKICRDEEYVETVDEHGVIYMSPCVCRAKNQTMSRLEKSGLGDILTRCTFRTFTTREVWQAEAKDKAMNYANNHQDKWLYVGGQVGSGKTHLCTAVVLELIKQGLDARYMLWRDEAVTLKSLVTKEDEYRDAIQPFKTVDVLYIDDFLKTRQGQLPTTGDVNLAFELLNYRYINSDLVTIISSELSIDEIINIDEAVGSRIFQRTKGNCIIIKSDQARNYRLIG